MPILSTPSLVMLHRLWPLKPLFDLAQEQLCPCLSPRYVNFLGTLELVTDSGSDVSRARKRMGCFFVSLCFPCYGLSYFTLCEDVQS